MSEPVNLRKDFIKRATPVVNAYVDVALGKGALKTSDKSVSDKVWEAMNTIIQQADDPVPLAKLTDGDITARVDAVLSQVASGEITPDEGKKLIGLLQAGFDITELPKLIAAIEAAECE